MTNLKNYVQSLRDAARIKARAMTIADIMCSIGEQNKEINLAGKEIEKHNKIIATLNFEISQICDNDPAKDEKIEKLNKSIKENEDTITHYQEYISKRGADIEKLDKEIEDVSTGKTKMSLGAINLEVANYLAKDSLDKFMTTEEASE